jgi:hypothetical protein
VEEGAAEHFCKNPSHERTKLFLSQILLWFGTLRFRLISEPTVSYVSILRHVAAQKQRQSLLIDPYMGHPKYLDQDGRSV